MAKNVRLIDIAKKLDISTVTVSKALSNQKGVSEEMREKIKELAKEMGYVKYLSSVDEKKKINYTIGVIVAERFLDENQSFYWKMYQEVSQNAMQHNFFTILEVISYTTENNPEIPKIISENKVDGLIILGTLKLNYAKYLSEESSVPLIYLDSMSIDEHCDSVVSNNLLGGYHMTNYLFEHGHSKIGYVGTRLATSSIDDRYLGYVKACMEHGINVNEEWIIEDRDRESGKVDYETKFVLPKKMPTAFFCNCDLTAGLLIRKLREKGFKVPEEISIVGFDNYMSDDVMDIGLTTYEINTKEMAKKAIHILIKKIENPRYSSGMYMLPGRFIERDSVKKIDSPVPFA